MVLISRTPQLTVAQHLGVHSPRLRRARALRTAKGRREQERFTFEGPTLLGEARASSFPIEEIYVTPEAYAATELVRELDEAGTPVYLLDAAAAEELSDVATPSGIVAVARPRLSSLESIFAEPAPPLVLADLGDPANVGSLLRSADAFGAGGVVFGGLGVEPFHPKVVRGSMGAVFRLRIALAEPAGVAAAARDARVHLLGLDSRGTPFVDETWGRPAALVVGHERQGLARWEPVCDALVAIPMPGRAESLSAGVAGSIALFEATRPRTRK